MKKITTRKSKQEELVKEPLPQLSMEKINEVLSNVGSLGTLYKLVYESDGSDDYYNNKKMMYDIGEELFLLIIFNLDSYGCLNEFPKSISFVRATMKQVTTFEPAI